MPISFRLVSGGRGVVYEASGVLTGREVIAANKQAALTAIAAPPALRLAPDPRRRDHFLFPPSSARRT